MYGESGQLNVSKTFYKMNKYGFLLKDASKHRYL